jgi:hypothetical protein
LDDTAETMVWRRLSGEHIEGGEIRDFMNRQCMSLLLVHASSVSQRSEEPREPESDSGVGRGGYGYHSYDAAEHTVRAPGGPISNGASAAAICSL